MRREVYKLHTEKVMTSESEIRREPQSDYDNYGSTLSIPAFAPRHEIEPRFERSAERVHFPRIRNKNKRLRRKVAVPKLLKTRFLSLKVH